MIIRKNAAIELDKFQPTVVISSQVLKPKLEKTRMFDCVDSDIEQSGEIWMMCIEQSSFSV